MDDSNEHEHRFQTSEELRVVCKGGPGATVFLRLLIGTADIFGSPLQLNTTYEFPAGSRFSVTCSKSSSSGGDQPQEQTADARNNNNNNNSMCVVSVRGNASCQAVPNALGLFNEFHEYVNATRAECSRTGARGPRILFCGPHGAGTTTLCKVVANHAIANDFSVALIDADMTKPLVSLPGCISTVFLDDFISVDDGFTSATPLTYFLGETRPPDGSASWGKFMTYAKRTYAVVEDHMDMRAQLNDGGVVVNMPSYTPRTMEDTEQSAKAKMDEACNRILHYIAAFNINTVCVIGDAELTAALPNAASDGAIVSTAFITRGFDSHLLQSSDNVESAAAMPLRQSATKVREYFHGVRTRLQCFRVTVPNVSTKVRIVRTTGSGTVVTVDIAKEAQSLRYAVAAVTRARSEEELFTRNVAGFVVILNVSPETDELQVLSPSPTSLPGGYLIVSPSAGVAATATLQSAVAAADSVDSAGHVRRILAERECGVRMLPEDTLNAKFTP